MKQTSIEWLYDQLTSTWYDKDSSKDILQQAKEMHRQEIINSHVTGLIYPLEIEATKQAELYYNETYGGNK